MTSKENDKKKSPAGQPSKKRLLLFKLISIIIPCFVLLALEVGLRLFNYGFNPNLFIDYSPDTKYSVLNPEASKKYFINQDIATTGNTEPFKKEKDVNTIRIFVLGESTTIGYPYFHNGSFHRWLLYRLMHSVPDKNFEIINLSLTAVNSYTVLGFAKEVVNYQPDAVMIYSGHNEYYGALGVGSTGKIGGSPASVNAVLALRQLKLVQLMTNIYKKVSSVFSRKKTDSGKARMELMVQDQEIAYGSDLFNRGINQFKSNLDVTLNLFYSHHIPVFLSNIVSNEKDLKPFADAVFNSIKNPAFIKNYAMALQAINNKDSATALKYFTSANQSYPSHASCNFYLGKLAYCKTNYGEAKNFFSKARNLDALRFRAPSEMNEIINELCIKYPNTHLVDAVHAFETSSKGNIVGNELILEHVHPNLKGYALLSNAFYESLKKEKIFSITKGRELSFEKLLQVMPITALDSLTGDYRIRHLKKSWPFNEATALITDSISFNTDEQKLAFGIAFQHLGWSEATETLYSEYVRNHDLLKAKTLVETLVLEHPIEEIYYNNAANICGELKDYDNAVFYFKKSFSFSPSFDKAKFLFVMYFMMDNPDDAMPYLDYAINNGHASLKNIKTLAVDIIQLKNTSLKKDSLNINVLNEIAGRYLMMGNKEGTEKYLHKALLVDQQNKDALTLFAQLTKYKNQHESH